MATVSHYLEYLSCIAVMHLARAMTPRMADAFGAALGRIGHSLITSRRRVAYENLKAALGNCYVDSEIRALTRQVFQNFGRTFIETARFHVMTPEHIRGVVEESGIDTIECIRKQGKGVIVCSAHFGNWDLFGAWLSAKDYPISFVVAKQHNPLFNELMHRVYKAINVDIIELPAGTRKIFRSLHNNQLIGMAADQHAPSKSVIVDFFGRPAAAAKGPALFALRTGCPILPLLMRRERFDRHVVMSGEPIYPPNTGSDEEDIRRMTTAFMEFFEEKIRQYPNQWLWTHRRWKI